MKISWGCLMHCGVKSTMSLPLMLASFSTTANSAAASLTCPLLPHLSLYGCCLSPHLIWGVVFANSCWPSFISLLLHMLWWTIMQVAEQFRTLMASHPLTRLTLNASQAAAQHQQLLQQDSEAGKESQICLHIYFKVALPILYCI